MIAVESVVIQRNLGPNRFCGGRAPVTDYKQPNTYAQNPDWTACKIARRAGVPTDAGRSESDLDPTPALSRTTGPSAVRSENTSRCPGSTASTSRTLGSTRCSPPTATRTNVRVRRAEQGGAGGGELCRNGAGNTPAKKLIRWLDRQNHERLERALRDHLERDDGVRRTDPDGPHSDAGADTRGVQTGRWDLRLLRRIRSLGGRLDAARS